MSIWTASFQDPIDEQALERAQDALSQANGPSERLLRLLQQSLAHTQAERASFLHRKRGAWFLVGQAGYPREYTDASLQPALPIRPSWSRHHPDEGKPLEGEAPLALLDYSAKIQDSIALEDAVHRGGWTQDPQVQEHGLRSVLCIPFAHPHKQRQAGSTTPPTLPPKESLSMQAEAPRNIDGALYLADTRQAALFRPGRIALVEVLLLAYLSMDG